MDRISQFQNNIVIHGYDCSIDDKYYLCPGHSPYSLNPILVDSVKLCNFVTTSRITLIILIMSVR